MKVIFSLVSLIISFLGLQAKADHVDQLPTVPYVDLSRYVGKWYEIASIPAKFSNQCVSNATAEYTALPSGRIQVVNSCDTKKGERDVARALARVMDKSTNAKLEVSFVYFFKKFWFKILGFKVVGDYWVVELADDYSHVIVGHPEREFAWILSRTPAMAKTTLVQLNQRLIELGYDSCLLKTTPATGGIANSQPLCNYVQQ